MIEAQGLTKRYGNKLAVDQLSFQVRPGTVTGFLGPNGAGKSTTMRMILGLDSPTSGHVLVNGRPYSHVSAPLREVGALLDAKAMHGGRSAYNHLLCLAQSNGLPRRRVDEVLALVGVSAVAKKRTKGFSLGMGQRLGIASALLGDPGILMFDEPVNGLDPEGILWIRNLMKALAAEGRTVFVSSHLMSEMQVTADHLIVIGQGRLIADTSMRDFIERNSQAYTVVRSPQADKLGKLLTAKGGTVTPEGTDGALKVTGPEPAVIGDLAAEHGIALHELSPRFASLEEVYMRLTQNSVEYRAGMPGAGMPNGGPPQGWGQPGPQAGWG
ncbi:MAG: ATP-binding cassette domain-containing protein, partial [Streptomycetaceae bacterium]|nr:ATP-binding cassette domain-containing protein [Streptomycetaceae bacterium]